MSHVRKSKTSAKKWTEKEIKEALKQRKWQSVDIAISKSDLKKHFGFLNDAVVLRPSPEDVPLMTTTGIYGPIHPETKTVLTPGDGTGVFSESAINHNKKDTLIFKLDKLANETPEPKKKNRTLVNAKWISGSDGGSLSGLSSSSNVFGGTGTFIVKDEGIQFPVIDSQHSDFDKTLAHYGGKLLNPNESFIMGYDKILFGIQYDSRQPDYIRNYELNPHEGGGIFIEHHKFPHLFLPKPTNALGVHCDAKITLGREVEDFNKENPQYIFTTFRIPSNGSAIAIRPQCIHNDVYTNGKLTVFVAHTKADTVALRKSEPFTNLVLKDQED